MLVGQTISHYRILSELGAGGMGVVYHAEDTRLGRSLALKFLPDDAAGAPEAQERFRREARAASALNHPNICTIYEIDEHEGRPFIAMELLEGESLFERLGAGPLAPDEIIRYGAQIADALAAADDTALPTETVRREPLTREGTALGTVCYMSPEQARGEPLDRRSDLFSLGAVLYEACTGRRAFGGITTAVIYDALLHATPPPLEQIRPDLPPELGHIIRKALEKDSALRYQSATEIHADLKRLRRDTQASRAGGTPGTGTAVAAPAPRRWTWLAIAAVLVAVVAVAVVLRGRTPPPAPAVAPQQAVTLAVLPLENLGVDEDFSYLSLAVPDDITTALSHVPGLAVRPFSMTRRYTGDVDPATVAGGLGVDHLLTGHFAREGDGIRVSLEAMNVRDSRLLWKQVVTVAPDGLLALHERLSREVESGLLPALGVSAAADAGTRPVDPEAYELYLRALALGKDPQPAREAQPLLQRAVELDPAFAPAWIRLSDTYYSEAVFFSPDAAAERRSLQSARDAAERALSLDPGLVEAMQRLVILDTETGLLEEAYDRAAALVARRPDSAEAHFSLSYVLRYAGLLVEAARQCDVAHTLDPANPGLRSCFITFLGLGDLDRAKVFLDLDPESTVWHTFGSMGWRLLSGDAAGARDLQIQVRELAPQSQEDGPWLLETCVDGGSDEEIQAAARRERAVFLNSQDPEPILFMAYRHGYCGLDDDTLELLRLMVSKRYCSVTLMETAPLFAGVRELPGYAALHQAGTACRQAFVNHMRQAPPPGS